MKKSTKISISIFAVAIGSIFISEYTSPAVGNVNGPTQAACGDPKGSGATCAKSGCHTSNGLPTPGVGNVLTGLITSNVPVAGYTAGSVYTFSVSISRPGHTRYGFQISPQSTSGVFKGTLTATDVNTRLPFIFVGGAVATGKYITHANSSNNSWTFDWTAPTAGSGDVTFYGAFNAAGGSTNETGDSIFTSTILVPENLTTGIDELNNENVISIYPNPISNQFFINSNDGGNMTVYIMDINGRIIKSIKNAIAQQPINIEDLSNGSYLVKVETVNGCVIKKIVKK